MKKPHHRTQPVNKSCQRYLTTISLLLLLVSILTVSVSVNIINIATTVYKSGPCIIFPFHWTFIIRRKNNFLFKEHSSFFYMNSAIIKLSVLSISAYIQEFFWWRHVPSVRITGLPYISMLNYNPSFLKWLY